MSLPPTGLVIAEVDGVRCEFDGTRWQSEAPGLEELLNLVLQSVPRHHIPVVDVARRCLEKAGVTWRIVKAHQDRWPGPEPDGID